MKISVSWGTKGSDKIEALPAVNSKKTASDGAAVVEDVEKFKEDLEVDFKSTVLRASMVTFTLHFDQVDSSSMDTVAPLPAERKVSKLTEDDKHRRFRTHLLILWLLSNGLLIFGVT